MRSQRMCFMHLMLLMLLSLLQAASSFQILSPVSTALQVNNGRTTTTSSSSMSSCCSSSSSPSSSSALWAKARKARKSKKAYRSRPQQFYDAISEAKDKDEKVSQKETKKTKKSTKASTKAKADAATAVDPADAEREARAEEARRRMEERPDVSTMIVDEETGIEVIAQGKSVMDVVTRKPVRLSDLGPEYRLAQFFPGVPPDIREKYRFDWKTVEAPEMIEQLRQACSVKLDDGSIGIPKHPSVANKAIDFVLANRDRLGRRMSATLGRVQMRSMSLGNKQEAKENERLWRNFLTIENHISAPFRQMIMDAEGRVGPNFGNLDLMSFCNGELYERCANYVVLKGMVAHWEKKVVDADYIEQNPITDDNYLIVLSHGDPRRYLPDPPILFSLRECTQVCLMAQQMTKAFVETPELFGDFPPELRFLEYALSIKGGTPLRKFMIEEFCPAEGITPEALREGMGRLLAQLENMQIDPYGDLSNLLERLWIAMAVGTDDERDPYSPFTANTDPDGPGFFQTYTTEHEEMSLVRFFDSQAERSRDSGSKREFAKGLFDFGFGKESKPAPKRMTQQGKTPTYKVPEARAVGRPHELGWLGLLDDDKDEEKKPFGKVPPGRIIPDDE